jgi:hypothetical protein
MRSTMTSFVRRGASVPKTFNTIRLFAIGLAGFAIMISPAAALVGGPGDGLQHQLKQNDSHDSSIVEIVVRRTTAVGPRGNVASRTVVRPGVGRPGGWVRPAHYYWRPGGAIAAGAAIGFVAAARAAAWAGAPPAPGYCWYYSDPSQTQGFWDVCP